jgi:hypothetical protein
MPILQRSLLPPLASAFVVATLANLAGLGFAFRQDGTSRAQLQLATALAIKDLIAAHGVDGTRVLISSGVRTTVQEAPVVAELTAEE